MLIVLDHGHVPSGAVAAALLLLTLLLLRLRLVLPIYSKVAGRGAPSRLGRSRHALLLIPRWLGGVPQAAWAAIGLLFNSFQGGWVGFPKPPGPLASESLSGVTGLLLLLSKAAGWGSPSCLGHRHHVHLSRFSGKMLFHSKAAGWGSPSCLGHRRRV